MGERIQTNRECSVRLREAGWVGREVKEDSALFQGPFHVTSALKMETACFSKMLT
jgi:hypothetical protein